MIGRINFKNRHAKIELLSALLIVVPLLTNCGNIKEYSLLLNLSNCIAINAKNNYKEREEVAFQVKADDGYILPDITKIETAGITHPFSYELNKEETVANITFKIYNDVAFLLKQKMNQSHRLSHALVYTIRRDF